MNKIPVWQEGMTPEEERDIAYMERNLLVIMLAQMHDRYYRYAYSGHAPRETESGWYPHEGEGFENWNRVVSMDGGQITFHVPNDFDLGSLKKIEPNWDGHTTEQKWDYIMRLCNMQIEKKKK